MSLYEDEELGAPPAAVAVGWSKGVKLMQSHIQLKKAAAKTIPDIHPGSSLPSAQPKPRPAGQVLAPVIDLKTKQKLGEETVTIVSIPVKSKKSVSNVLLPLQSSLQQLLIYHIKGLTGIFLFKPRFLW